ncbi:hypothetical protein, partial [Parasynechococcus sp.]|uniref:hypothetical protein n=1 Tax=Parasynechococcus sp. TaxID=3101203 RepID=UPI0037042784
MAVGLRLALFRDHMQQIDFCGLQAGNVLEHPDHFFDVTLARVGNQKVPEHREMKQPLRKPMGGFLRGEKLMSQRYADHVHLDQACAPAAHRLR